MGHLGSSILQNELAGLLLVDGWLSKLTMQLIHLTLEALPRLLCNTQLLPQCHIHLLNGTDVSHSRI